MSRMPRLPEFRARGPARAAAEGAPALALHLPLGWPETAAAVRWLRRGPEGVEQGVAERLSDLAEDWRALPLHVWVSGAETLLTRAQVPTRARSKVLQALPYALEDQLLGEPEAQQFVYELETDGGLAVAVAERARVRAWLGALDAAGFRPRSLTSVALATPYVEGVWTVSWVADGMAVRTRARGGFSCAAAGPNPPALLAVALREAGGAGASPAQLALHAAPPEIDPELWSATLGVPVVRAESGGLAGFFRAPALNLLQQEFAPRRSAGGGMVLGPYKPAVTMFAVWFTLSLGIGAWEWWSLSRTSRAARAEMTDIFRRSFPEAKAIVDPVLQMERNLAALQAGGGQAGPGDFLSLVSRTSGALQGAAQMKLRTMQYGENALTVELTVADFQAAEAVKGRIAGAGLRAEMLGANAKAGGGVDARVKVRP